MGSKSGFRRRLFSILSCLALLLSIGSFTGVAGTANAAPPEPVADCEVDANNVKRRVDVSIIALDYLYMLNRLGASQGGGMIYALAQDVVTSASAHTDTPQLVTDTSEWTSGNFTALAGNVTLRPDKRARPITLRANQHECLQITFTNLLKATVGRDQSQVRTAGVHIVGTEMYNTINSAGSFVGRNPDSLADSGEQLQYSIYVPEQGNFVLYSSADTWGLGLDGQLQYGLFGALNVKPEGAEWYRSQVTQEDLALATTGTTEAKQPRINYQATFQTADSTRPWRAVGKPILNMLQTIEGQLTLVYSDLTAIISGPNTDDFPAGTDDPSFFEVPATPDRRQPYREFTIMYHEVSFAAQPF